MRFFADLKLYLLLVFGLTFGACQENNTNSLKAKLVLDRSQIDFGLIQNNDTLRQYLTVQNKGTAPLLIEDIQSSCGCTIPRWENVPILPGQQQRVEVLVVPPQIEVLENGKERIFHKKIVIRSNTDSLFTVVEVSGRLGDDF